jgi:hypothetical protein
MPVPLNTAFRTLGFIKKESRLLCIFILPVIDEQANIQQLSALTGNCFYQIVPVLVVA